MLPHVPCGMLNGTRCPKSQPAILDQTIFKLRVFKLKTVSYKVQCSKDIIFTAITSTQTRESVLHSHRLEKKCEFLHIPEKKKIIAPMGNILATVNPPQTASAPSCSGYCRILRGQGALSNPGSFFTIGFIQMVSSICIQNLEDLYLDVHIYIFKR